MPRSSQSSPRDIGVKRIQSITRVATVGCIVGTAGMVGFVAHAYAGKTKSTAGTSQSPTVPATTPATTPYSSPSTNTGGSFTPPTSPTPVYVPPTTSAQNPSVTPAPPATTGGS